jgi:integrating conjugative element protein (TIGR03761 family)
VDDTSADTDDKSRDDESLAKRPSLLAADRRMRELSPSPIQVLTALPYAARPGRLRGVSVLTIKTYLAQQLVFGRAASHDADGKRGIIGLIGFAGMLTQLFNGAKADDPYADKWLLDIEATIDAAAEALKDAHDTVLEALAQRADVSHGVAQSVKPLHVPLYFSNRFAYRAAYLVNDFDNLFCAIQTAKHVAFLTNEQSNALIHSSSKTVRRTFTSANGYRYTGVSRADIAYGTARAVEALQRWGELSPDILDGTRRAEYGPPLPAESFADRIVANAQGAASVE